MDTILLSIKPEYANKIFDGSKTFEFRKQLAHGSIRRIIIYVTSPVKQIIGEVEVVETLSMKKTPLWEITKHAAGISRRVYRDYFSNCSLAHAYCLGKVTRYCDSKTLSDFGLVQPPQSFAYINK